MSFPTRAVDYANDLVRSASVTSMSPEEKAEWIYSHLGKFDYGINEAILSGTRFRYPDQIATQLTCGEAGVYVYMLAKAAGLDPRIFRLTEYWGRPADHLSVDAQVNGNREVIDPLGKIKGPVKYRLGRLVVNKKSHRYRGIEVMDEDSVEDFIQHMNARQGVLDYLAAKQRFGEYKGSFGTMTQFVSYSSETGLTVDLISRVIPRWVIQCSMEGSSPLWMKIRISRNVTWGGVTKPFFETTTNIKTNQETSTFYPENAYHSLERDVLKALMYYFCVEGARVNNNGDGVYQRSHEENERFAKPYLEGSEDEAARKTLEDLEETERELPEFHRRYLDYFVFVNLDYPQRTLRNQTKQLLLQKGDSTTEQMVDLYADILYRQMRDIWIDYFVGNEALLQLSSDIQGALADQKLHYVSSLIGIDWD